MIKQYLQEKHQISNYQIAQIEFLLKSFLSEFSKILIMGILFHQYLKLYLFALCIMLYLRRLTGGLHFYTYLRCLTCSFIYLWLAIIILPSIALPYCLQATALLISMLICYFVGPVVSKYCALPSFDRYKHCRNMACIGIYFYMLILYMLPVNQYTIISFWVIELHSLQLLAAKIYKRGGKT